MTGTVDPNSPYGRLAIAVADLADRGERTPCQGLDAYLWTSDRAVDREAATYRCAGCPLIDLCQCVIEATPRTRHWHVWAGKDWTPKTKTTVIAA